MSTHSICAAFLTYLLCPSVVSQQGSSRGTQDEHDLYFLLFETDSTPGPSREIPRVSLHQTRQPELKHRLHFLGGIASQHAFPRNVSIPDGHREISPAIPGIPFASTQIPVNDKANVQSTVDTTWHRNSYSRYRKQTSNLIRAMQTYCSTIVKGEPSHRHQTAS